MLFSLPSLALRPNSRFISRLTTATAARLPGQHQQQQQQYRQQLSGLRTLSYRIRIDSIARHHSTCSSSQRPSTTMSAPGSTTTSRKQPPWRVPEGKPVPKLKLYNSMTRTKVNESNFTDKQGTFEIAILSSSCKARQRLHTPSMDMDRTLECEHG